MVKMDFFWLMEARVYLSEWVAYLMMRMMLIVAATEMMTRIKMFFHFSGHSWHSNWLFREYLSPHCEHITPK